MGTVSAPMWPGSEVRVPWYRRVWFRVFVGFFLVFFVLFVVLLGLVHYEDYNTLMERTLRHLEAYTELAATNMETQFRDHRRRLATLLMLQGFQQDLTLLPKTTEDPVVFQRTRVRLLSAFTAQVFQGEQPFGVDAFVIADAQGRIWVASEAAWEGQSLPQDLLKALENLSPDRISAFFIWGDAPWGWQGLWAGVAHRMRDLEQRPWWVIALVSPSNFGTWAQSYFASEGYLAFMLPNGRVYMLPSPNEVQLVTDETVRGFLQETQTVDTWTTFLLAPFQGRMARTRFEAVEPIHEAEPEMHAHYALFLPQEGGQLGVAIPLVEALPNTWISLWYPYAERVYPLFRKTARLYGYGSLGLVVFLALVSAGLARRLSAPLMELTRHVQAFAEGKWDTRVVVQGWGEVQILGATFNHMAASLARLYRTMEEEVRRRTYQIQLFLRWFQEEAPRDQISLERYLRRLVEGLSEALPAGIHPVLLWWNPEQYTLNSRWTPPNSPVAQAPDPEQTWLREALRLRRPLTLVRETHGETLPQDIQAVWVYPLRFQETDLGALVLYGLHTEGLGTEFQEMVYALSQTLSAAMYFALMSRAYHHNRQMAQVFRRFLDTVQPELDVMEALFLLVRFLERYSPRALMMVPEGEGIRRWRVVYPATFAGKTLEGLVPPAREQVWAVEPDLDALRAVQRYPKDLRVFLREQGWNGAVLLPLWTPQRLMGLVVLGMAHPGEYSEDVLWPLAMGFSLFAMLLERAEAETHIRLHQAGRDFLFRALQAPALGQALSAFVGWAREALRDDTDMVFAFPNRLGEMEHIFLFQAGQERFHLVVSPVERQAVEKVFREGHSTYMPSARDLLTWLDIVAAAEVKIPQSWAALPVRLGNRTIGVWAVRDMDQPGRFGADTLREMEALSPWLAAAAFVLINRQWYEDRLQRVEWIHALGMRLMDLWDPQLLTNEVAQEFRRIFQAENVRIRLHSPRLTEALARHKARDKDGGSA